MKGKRKKKKQSKSRVHLTLKKKMNQPISITLLLVQWNSGGSCDGETLPITNDTYLSPYPWMMSILESVISGMKTPVFFLNITKMTDYRKDGHPSIFSQPETITRPGMVQDCSHWYLPGIRDSWNELLYATLLTSHNIFS